MNLQAQFVFTDETKAVLPYVTENGALHSLIIQGDKVIEVSQSQMELVDANLRRNHSSLRGAKDSAAYILGSSSMYPVVMCAVKQHIWFPTEGYNKLTTAWFALHHVIGNPVAINQSYSTIALSGEWEITLPVPITPLKNRLNQAHVLRSSTCKMNILQYAPSNKRQLLMVSDGYRVEYKVNNLTKNKEAIEI